MAFKSKADKLAAAQAAAAQPLRVTDAEFALLKLRECFVEAQVRHHNQIRGVIVSADAASQPLLSTAVAELFKKKFGLASSGADPEWFVKLQECAAKSSRPFMTLDGPWDMCVNTLRFIAALFDPPLSYTVFAILKNKFTDIVLPGLTLSGADADDTRFKLECLIRDVLVTRNWVSHETLSVQEVKRGMQSLVDALPVLNCDPSLEASTASCSLCNSGLSTMPVPPVPRQCCALASWRAFCSCATATASALLWASGTKSQKPSMP